MNYEKIYADFIADRRGKEAVALAHRHEKHHVLPRSLGGSDEPDNLLALTLRDHLFAHAMLAKMHGGPMWHAFNFMVASRNIKTSRDKYVAKMHGEAIRQSYRNNPEKVEAVRRRQNELMQDPKRREHLSKQLSSYFSNPAARERVSRLVTKTMSDPARRAEIFPEERRKKTSELMRQRHQLPGMREKGSTRSKAYWGQQDSKDAQAQKMVARWTDPEYAARQRAGHLAVMQSPEHRAKMSAALIKAGANPELRQKRSENQKLRMQNPDVVDALSKRISQLVWVNNGVENRRVLATEIPDGFVRGRYKCPR